MNTVSAPLTLAALKIHLVEHRISTPEPALQQRMPIEERMSDQLVIAPRDLAVRSVRITKTSGLALYRAGPDRLVDRSTLEWYKLQCGRCGK
jgi:hypothetical protein